MPNAPIRNLGGTCYLGCALQCLASSLCTCMCRGHSSELERCWHIFKDFLKNSQESVDPGMIMLPLFKECSALERGRQQDASEAVSAVLGKMGCERGFFSGEFLMRRNCLSCGKRSQKREEFLILNLSLEEHLHSSFQSMTQPTAVEYKCDCGSGTSLMRMTLDKLPKILLLCLKRFRSDDTKNTGPVSFPFQYAVGGRLMRLKWVIEHRGEERHSGHYVCRIRFGREWFLYNDSKRTRCGEDFNLLSREVYMLAYKAYEGE